MNDQAKNLRKKIESLRTIGQAKTIAVVSGKGGVGKSNFALNFSLCLANHNKRVLLFDLDIGMGNIDILLGLTASNSIVNMFDEQLTIQDIVETGPNSLSYIAGGSGLTDIFTMDETKFDYFLHQLNHLLNDYDFIIFDMGAGITEASSYYMLAVDECIVITTPEPTSMTDAYAMIKHASRKSPFLPMYLIVNRSLNRRIGEQTMERLQHVVRSFLEKELIPLGILPEDKIVLQAVTSQVPFLLFRPKADITITMTQIVQQYLDQNVNRSSSKKPPFAFVTKLKHFFRER
ncbi:MinD/ParA family protein [Aquibacillus sp. 3ASR75-11]|uniref:MinD/ParA family protein n=1 Tax=Terrihalobacillus insolitus TaxID=2950438 RepID=A0A9X3WUI3_9BACI|nr:MinD/ParA family protein [Terrihalobacillus insolitus]MDC3414118.1 MinD/ParA family protein [Terrihalobacillus insolitus]MDC3423559.1 MinD/ParA family protein [Terrihalobacillus insolitus]